MILKSFIYMSLCLLFILFSPKLSINASANPFLGENGKKHVAPPPVYSVGSGSFLKLQFEFRDKIANVLRGIKHNRERNLFPLLIIFSFLYGLFHAAGPGHRKTVVFSLFLARKVKWHVPACAGFLSAGVHAGGSIAVISLLYFIQKAFVTLSDTDSVYAYMEGITFVILALFSLIFIIYKIMTFGTPIQTDTVKEKRGIYPLIIVSSIVPCPGATMLLLLALYTGMPGAGIAGVIAMSFGMGLVISFAGYLAFAGRTGIFSLLKHKEYHLRKLSASLEIFSFFIILLFSAIMSWPFIRSIAGSL